MPAVPLLRDLRLFLARVVAHGVLVLTSSVIAAGFAFWEHRTQRSVHMPIYAAFVSLAFLWATFKAWQEQRASAIKAECELERLAANDSGAIMRQISDPFFWLLSVIQRHGAHRGSVQGISESISGAWWIGETAISIGRSKWLYTLLDSAVEKGFLIPEGAPPQFVPPPPVERSLEADQRRSRPVVTPGEKIFDPRFEQPVRLDL